MIKSQSRKSVTLQLLVIVLTAAVAGSALARPRGRSRYVAAQRFEGVVEAVEEYDFHFPTVWAYGTGGGTAAHLGRYTVKWEAKVNLPTGAGVSAAHFVAANGDSLYSTSVSQSEPTGTPDEFRVVELHTIAGGTGRFAGATGSFTVVRLEERSERTRRDGATAGSFDGTIELRNAR